MTNTRDKFSGGGGDYRPLPQIPASLGDGKKTQRTASVPIENCLTEGVQSVIMRSFRGRNGNLDRRHEARGQRAAARLRRYGMSGRYSQLVAQGNDRGMGDRSYRLC